MVKSQNTFDTHLKEFISKAKYILKLTSNKDVCEYISNLLLEILKVDWVLFVHVKTQATLGLDYSSIDDKDLIRAFLSEDVREKIFTSQRKGIVTFHEILLPAGFMSFILPITTDNNANMILVASYETSSLPVEELLEAYKTVGEIISILNELRLSRNMVRTLQMESMGLENQKNRYFMEENFGGIVEAHENKNAKGKALYDIEYWLNESQRVARIGYFVLELQSGNWKSSKVLDEIFGITQRFDKSLEDWKDIVHPDYRCVVIDEFHSSARINKNNEMDYIIIRQDDGQERWVRGVWKYDFDKEKNPVRILGTVQDITDEKLAAESQRAYEERFFKFFQQTPYVLGIIRLSDDQIIEVNEEFAQFFGVEKEEIIGKTTLSLNMWADIQKRFEMHRIIHEKGCIREFENKIRIKDGSIRDTVMSLQVMVVGGEASIAMLIRDVTEERLAEEDKARLAVIVQSADEAIWGLDTEGIVQMLNPAAEHLFGYSRKEILGKNVGIVFEKESRDIFLDMIFSLKGRRKSFSIESKCQHKTGEIIEVEISVSAILNNQKRLTGISVIMKDITKRKQVLAALKESEEKYKILFEDSVDPALIIDGGEIISANSAAFKIFECNTREELLSKRPAQISPYFQNDGSDSKHKADLMMNMAYEHGMSRFEWVYKKINGEYFIADVALSRFPLNGKYMLHALLRDITEKKKLENELISLNRKFLSHIKNMPLAYIEIGKDMIINDWNPFAEEIFGYSREESVGKKITDLIFTKYTQIVIEMMSRGIGEGHAGTHNISENITKNKERIICEWYNTPLLDNNENVIGCVSLVKDITIAKKNEAALKMAKEQAESANAAKSEFIANMSHEIRTPLNAVIGFSELLSDALKDSKQKSYVNSINLAGKSLLTLINDILDLSKIEAGMMHVKYTYVQPAAIFYEIRQIFKQKIEEKNLALIIDVDKTLPAGLYLDEIKIRQVLLNLVGNAIKFTDKGSVELTAKRINKADNKNQNTIAETKVNLSISIKDTGIGIPENEHEKIFESFRQQSDLNTRKYGGTGLGLSISKKLVEMMHGKIYLESIVGKGSTFTIELYDIEVDMHPTEHIREAILDEAESVIFDGGKILVVDDIEDNRVLLNEMLGAKGLEVFLAENGKEAYQKAIEIMPDLILMDIRMPVMPGNQAAKLIRENHKVCDTKILALTASSTQDELVMLMEDGFDGYLLKPISSQRLIGEMCKYLKVKESIRIKDDGLKKEDVFEKIDLKKISKESRTKLTSEILPSLKKLEGAMKISEVVRVAKDIVEFGDSIGKEQISREGRRLIDLTQTFDVGEIKKVTRNLLKVLEGMKR